jgi:hypothetical protein
MPTNKDFSRYNGLYPQLTIRAGDHMRDRLFEIRLALADSGESVSDVSMSRVVREAVDMMHRNIVRREAIPAPERAKSDWSSWRGKPGEKVLKPEVRAAQEDFLKRHPHLR